MEHNKERTIEIIVDELQKNGINTNITKFSERMHYILNKYEDTYNTIVEKLDPNWLKNVFYEMEAINVGRVLAYLALVCRMNTPEENLVREAVSVVVPVLKSDSLENDDDLCMLTALHRVPIGDGCILYFVDLP